jgi:adenine-specific DNA-methyltransferase
MDISAKKQNGVVLTPEWVVDFMVGEIFSGVKIKGDEKILDTGCGEGVFSTIAAKKFAKLSGKSIDKVIEENIYFIDISPEYVEKTKLNLQNLTDSKILKFNAIIGDFCDYDFKDEFDFIIGNPPYVRIKNLNERRDKLQKKFVVAANGSIDLYFCFFEQALKIIKNSGSISFITPNSHFHSFAGKGLRNLLLPHIVKIINFDHFQVFENATAYTAITFLKKRKTENFLYAQNFKKDFFGIEYGQILKQKLSVGRWEFLSDDSAAKMAEFRKKYSKLDDVADIHYGLATLKDDAYIFSPERIDEKYFYFADHQIEKNLCVPIIKASTYKGQDQNLYIIFPYENERIISQKKIKEKYPKAYDYFLSRRDILAARDKGGGINYSEFYAFGRSQGLRTSFGKKIITSTMNITPRFFVVENEKTTFFAGYCVKPKYDYIDIYRLCDALNSDLMKEYIESVSRSYRGGYKSYAKSFLKDFVHPQFYKSQATLF